jgi:uncharacterized protein with HEPN domain
MKPHTRRRLLDAAGSARELGEILAGKSLADLRDDRVLLLAVLKLLEVTGEALNKARRHDGWLEREVPGLQRYVHLRNQLVHDYDKVDIPIIWEVTQSGIPRLRASIDAVLSGRPSPGEHRRRDRRRHQG